MSIFSSIGKSAISFVSSANKKVISTLSSAGKKVISTFAPSPEVSAQRRQDVFGTTNKAVVGTAIVGTATALITAPAIVGALGGSKAVAKSVLTGINRSSITTKVVGGAVATVGTPILIGAVSKSPTIIPKAIASGVEFQGNLFNLGKNPTGANLLKVAKDNPIITGAILGGTALVVGKTAFPIISNLSNTIATNKNTQAIKESLESPSNMIPLPSAILPATLTTLGAKDGKSPIPLTPETQVLGKSVNSTSVVKRRKTKTHHHRENSNRISLNIYNQTKALYNRGHSY